MLTIQWVAITTMVLGFVGSTAFLLSGVLGIWLSGSGIDFSCGVSCSCNFPLYPQFFISTAFLLLGFAWQEITAIAVWTLKKDVVGKKFQRAFFLPGLFALSLFNLSWLQLKFSQLTQEKIVARLFIYVCICLGIAVLLFILQRKYFDQPNIASQFRTLEAPRLKSALFPFFSLSALIAALIVYAMVSCAAKGANLTLFIIFLLLTLVLWLVYLKAYFLAKRKTQLFYWLSTILFIFTVLLEASGIILGLIAD
jgi:hypothetical protein